MAKIIRVEKCSDCNFNTVLYEDYYKTSGNTYCLKASRDIYIEDIPSWCPLEDVLDGPNGFHYALCSKSDTGEGG